MPSFANTQELPLMRENSDTMFGREALKSVCELLGGITAWVARHDAAGSDAVMLLGPAFGIDSELYSALELMVSARHQGAVHVKPWKGHTLLCAFFPIQWDAGGHVHSLGMLFAGQFELTEWSAGVIEGVRCCLETDFSRSLSEMHLNSHTRMPAHAVVCSCCRRTPSPQYGWMHWDDLRFIETGHACSHTVCERCASELYGDVLCGKN